MPPRNRFKFAPGVTIDRRLASALHPPTYDGALEDTSANLLIHATADAEEVLGCDTYEAQAPGDFAITIARLHGLVEGVDMGLLREYLHHITIHHEHDQIQHTGLYQIFDVNLRNFGTAEEVQAQVAYQEKFTGLEYAKLSLRVLFTNWQSSGKLDTVETLNLYAHLFQKCDITTVSIPTSWAAQFAANEQLEAWLSEYFPNVDRTQKHRYIAHRQKYTLFGNDSFVGDRVRTSTESWGKAEDDNTSSDATHAGKKPKVEDAEGNGRDMYISHAPRDLAVFIKNLLEFRDAHSGKHVTVISASIPSTMTVRMPGWPSTLESTFRI